ncbi:MAG: tyrosine-type recombinase/integrase [Ginsengibacter sp.]
MKKEKQTINELLNEFENYLISLNRSKFTIRQYKSIWKKFEEYAASCNVKYYDRTIGNMFIRSQLENYAYADLNQMQKRLVNTIDALFIFQQEGVLKMGPAQLKRKQPRKFEGEIGLAMEAFINYKRMVFSLAKTTLRAHHQFLHDFLLFLNDQGVKKMVAISQVYISSFIKSLPANTLALNHSKLGVIKSFLHYAFEEQLLTVDYASIIQRDNYKAQPKVPSVFSLEEIKCLLQSVERSNPSGKRDYVIILLAAKLGMRAGDIAGLKFKNINWDKRFIHFTQFKTNKELVLPLLPEVGNAIIDYLKHGRPISNDPNCLLQLIGPYKAISAGDVGRIVQSQMQRANINTKHRRHGPHALRHSFATNMLQNKTSLPVISEALGHTSTESTMYYLRVSTDQLKQCALEVPIVAASFYNQKGGFKS